MLMAAALMLAQGLYDPHIHDLLRTREETKAAQRAEDQSAPSADQPSQTKAPAPQDDSESLAAALPPDLAKRLAACLAKANEDPQKGLADAMLWAKQKGGAYADQCRGYALGRAGRWSDAAAAFEIAAGTIGLDRMGQARLWAQGGNAALVAGEHERAARDFDRALAHPLPPSLATGEMHLDRARTRVALGDLAGARADLNLAIQLAPADPLTWLLSATLARRQHDLKLAREQIVEAVKRAGKDPSVALEQGVILALSGGHDNEARAAFARAEKNAPAGSQIAKSAKAYLAELGAEVPSAETTSAPAAGTTAKPAPLRQSQNAAAPPEGR